MKTLFIFFNGGGLHKEQWSKHPYKKDPIWKERKDEHEKTNLIKKIQKYGDVYLYDPIFYLNKEDIVKGSTFKLEDLDLNKHCKKIYDTMKDYKNFFIISHSRGWIISKFFIKLYSKKVIGYINIDGGEYPKFYLERFKNRINMYEKINNNDLNELFKKVKKGDNEAYRKISDYVKVNMYLQDSRCKYDYKNVNMYILNNIYNDDEVNVGICEYGKDTLLSKFKYCEQFKKMKNCKIKYYVGMTHYLYFFDQVKKDILKIISKKMKK